MELVSSSLEFLTAGIARAHQEEWLLPPLAATTAAFGIAAAVVYWRRRRYARARRESVWRIAVTGGPCSGKTTVLTELRERVKAAGYRVYVVPECATMLFAAGLSLTQPPGCSDATKERLVVQRQTAMMRMQLAMEDIMIEEAALSAEAEGVPAVVFTDRGLLDGKAYCTAAEWSAVLQQCHLSDAKLRRRYHAVVHLVTVAAENPTLYTTSNNAARSESAGEAQELDERTYGVWGGHANRIRITARSSFADKLESCTKVVLDFIRCGGEVPRARDPAVAVKRRNTLHIKHE